MGSIRVLVVDDQELFASGIQIILRESHQDDIKCVGIASNGKDAVRLVDELRPDVILMDVRMPVMDGVTATEQILQKHPGKKILILTTFDDDQYVIEALNAGAVGYVLKNIRPEELITAIRAVSEGHLLVTQSVGYKLVQKVKDGIRQSSEGTVARHGRLNAIRSCFEYISSREAEILMLMMEDLDNREIADTLFIAEQTVRNYVSSIYAKLGVSDRNHAKKLIRARLGEAGA